MAEKDAQRRPPPPRASLSRTLLIFMFFLSLFILIDPGLREGFGAAAGAVFGPTIGFGTAYPVITILIAGSLTTIISSVVRHVFTDWVKMTRVGRQMSALRKAQMEALRRGNPSKVEKLREVQASMARETMEVQMQPMKSMGITFLLFIIVFAWLGNFVYLEAVSAGRVFFAVPWSPTADLTATYVFPSWILLYSLLAIPASQIASRLLKFFSFRKKLTTIEAQGG